MSSATRATVFQSSRTAVRDQPAISELSSAIAIYRVVVGLIIVSLLWKCRVFPSAWAAYSSLHLKDGFFPDGLTQPGPMAVFFFIPISTGLIVMFTKNVTAIRIQAGLTTVCMLGLCLHQYTYNDVTFLTSFWVSLWCLWFAMRLGDPIDLLLSKGKTFAVLIISMVFLGGAAGKWTPGYWSGEVLYQIYFIDRDFWFFNILRNRLEPDSLRAFATGYSRMVIITETMCAFLWLLPPHIASAIALSVFVGIIVFSNFNLVSVMACMLGLCLIGLHQPKTASRGIGR